MYPLTKTTPKPLLTVANKPLIVYQLEALAAHGIDEIVINISYLGYQIKNYLGDGHAFNVNIHYAEEGEVPLETAGGIINALPYLGDAPFIVVNADIYTDFDYSTLPLTINSAAHLVLVNNPDHHTGGDFVLTGAKVTRHGGKRLTYSGIAVFAPKFFKHCQPGRLPLAPLLQRAAQSGLVTGQYFDGLWYDVGTPERLAVLNQKFN